MTSPMGLGSTRYTIPARVPEEKRKRHSRRDHKKRGRNWTNRRKKNLPAKHEPGKDEKRRISPLHENIRDKKEHGRSIAVQRKADHRRSTKKTRNNPTLSRWWKDRTSRIQGNPLTSDRNGILEFHPKTHREICEKMSRMPKETGYRKNWDRRTSGKTRKSIDTSLHWPYHKAT